jgi:sec-independent protein translocase protein TatA
MFENLSLPHLLMVLAVAILVFGPKRIPEIAGSMGKGIREFKRHLGEASRPDVTADDPEHSRSVINEGLAATSTEVSRAGRPDSSERGEPKRLLD